VSFLFGRRGEKKRGKESGPPVRIMSEEKKKEKGEKGVGGKSSNPVADQVPGAGPRRKKKNRPGVFHTKEEKKGRFEKEEGKPVIFFSSRKGKKRGREDDFTFSKGEEEKEGSEYRGKRGGRGGCHSLRKKEREERGWK